MYDSKEHLSVIVCLYISVPVQARVTIPYHSTQLVVVILYQDLTFRISKVAHSRVTVLYGDTLPRSYFFFYGTGRSHSQ